MKKKLSIEVLMIKNPFPNRQRAVIGMFDPSARPCVPANVLTFAVPYSRFEKMVSYMEESFLITGTWDTIKKRILSKTG